VASALADLATFFIGDNDKVLIAPESASSQLRDGKLIVRSQRPGSWIFQIWTKEALHFRRTSIFNGNFWHGVQITCTVSTVIPPVWKAVPDVIDGFIHESFFSPEMGSQNIHGGAVRFCIRPEQRLSDEPSA
jgi:hypothetical protein